MENEDFGSNAFLFLRELIKQKRKEKNKNLPPKKCRNANKALTRQGKDHDITADKVYR